MADKRAGQWPVLAALTLCTAAAHAEIRVSLNGVDGAARANIEALLSVNRYRDRNDIDEDFAQRLANRIEDEVKDAMRPFGFYEPAVKAQFTREGSGWHYDIQVEPGPAVYLNSVDISVTGPGAEDQAFDTVRAQEVLEPGMRLSHSNYERVKGEMARAAAANGYLGAQFEQAEFLVDTVKHTADVSLHMETGPQYRFGDITIDQDVIRPELMRRFLRFSEGEPFSASKVLGTQFALDDSLYFSTVEVDPGVNLGDRDDTNLTVPVRITAKKSRWQLALGGGYGTDTQLRGTLGWTNTRLNDRGHRLRFELKASATTRRVDARYDIPIGDPALERFSVEFVNKFEALGDLDTNETTVRPSVTRVSGRWQRITSLSATRTSTREGGVRSANKLLVPGLEIASVPEGFLGGALFSHGFSAEIIGSHSTLGSDADFLRLSLRGERSFDLDDLKQWHLLLRGEFGTSIVSEFSEVPGIYRFFAGGDQSVRGFAYKSLSPEEPDPRDPTKMLKTGGRHMIVGSVEVVRDLPLNLAAATFFDFGNAFNSFKDPIEYAAGVGVRYRLPVASIGLDFAKPLSTDGKIRMHLNFTVKL